MKHSKNALFFAVSLALALFIVACGSSTPGSGSSGRYGASSSSASTPSSGSAMTIKTTTLTVGGKAMTVLTNAQG
jgi:ABC-type glycerol-3-phosphate transport system substrate-binding protein